MGNKPSLDREIRMLAASIYIYSESADPSFPEMRLFMVQWLCEVYS
ncbi:hypothetical protein BCL69_102223 [Nitrosomonas communis]|uniref:Uncharacterized protein n=1 Tax=Nitrosomonas communis TaxID=44574 RepID=A0A5D3YBS7_9PROT|nr:hypothetical protein BCL69_102223 [Nitrosomonas communis]